MNTFNTEQRLEQIEKELDKILHLSFPLCKYGDADISNACSKINNIAFELKKITDILKKQVKTSEPL
jgi:hypothetical protein